MSNKIIDCQALLIICYEGKTKNLDEEKYFKQLNEHIKTNQSTTDHNFYSYDTAAIKKL